MGWFVDWVDNIRRAMDQVDSLEARLDRLVRELRHGLFVAKAQAAQAIAAEHYLRGQCDARLDLLIPIREDYQALFRRLQACLSEAALLHRLVMVMEADAALDKDLARMESLVVEWTHFKAQVEAVRVDWLSEAP